MTTGRKTTLKIHNRSLTNWFGDDPSATPCTTAGVDNGICAYGQPALGTFGTARVGSERVPGYQTYGASITKDFTIWHEQQINFRADADNLFNNAYLGNPGNNITNLTSSGFGNLNADIHKGNRQGVAEEHTILGKLILRREIRVASISSRRSKRCAADTRKI